MTLSRSPRLAAGAIAAATLLVAVPSAGAVDWTRPFDLSQAPVTAANPSVGIDDAGRSLTAWESDLAPGRIQIRTRAANGALGPITAISRAGDPAATPQVAMNASGVAAIAYTVFDGADHRLQVRVRSADGALSAAQTVSEAGGDVSEYETGIDDAGEVLLAWETRDGIRARVRDVAGVLGVSTSMARSAVEEEAIHPQVAMNAGGDGVVVWERSGNIEERFRPSGGSFGAARVDSSVQVSSGDPDVAIDGTGRHVVAYADRPNGGFDSAIEARARTAAGSLGPQRTIEETASTAPLSDPRVASDAAGLASIAYRAQVTDPNNGAAVVENVKAAVLPASGAPTAPVNMSFNHHDAGRPEIAIDAAGRSWVAWSVTTIDSGVNSHILARPLTAAGVAGRRTTLSELSPIEDEPSVALNGAGVGAAAWRGLNEFDPQTVVSGAFLAAP